MTYPEIFFFQNPEKSINLYASGVQNKWSSLDQAKSELKQGQIAFFKIPFYSNKAEVYLPKVFNLSSPLRNSPISLKLEQHNPDYEDWSKNFAIAHAGFQAKTFTKVVLARESVYKLETPQPPTQWLGSLFLNNKGQYAAGFGSERAVFVSKTPERLFKLENGTIETVAIAGTRKLSQGAFDTSKEDTEHGIVVDSIIKTLKTFSDHIYTHESETLELSKLKHLKTRIEASHVKNISLDELVSGLHPTPAVSGFPKRASLDWLAEHEPFDREMYAGVFGYLTPDFCEAIVMIRSLLATPEQIRVYAGVGTVQESDCEQEWLELDLKLEQILEGTKSSLSEARV